MPSFSKVANGTIVMSRFVKLDTTADGKVLQAGAGDRVYGISQPGSRNTPYSALEDGNAALAGENLNIFGPPSKCLLELGGTVVRGDRLKSDANGKGVTATADGDEYGAMAMVSGNAADLIEVEIMLGMRGA